MGKYWHVLNIGLQSALVYRVNFLFRASFGIIPLLAIIHVWRAIYEGKGGGQVASYGLSQMISYYLVITIVDALTAVTEDDWQIAADIKDGNISQFLLKPMDYLTYRFCLFASSRLVFAAVAVVPTCGFIWLLRDNFVLPPDAATAGWFALSVSLTALLQFLFSFTLALLAFWVLEVATFIFIAFAFEYLAGGHLFPLDLLPPAVAGVLDYTPFPYMLYFPVTIWLGRVTGDALWLGVLVQLLWVAATYALARLVWSRGIQKYSAVGG